MYLRTMGKRYAFFHTYRDGRGKVSQRRIHDLGDARELANWLRPENWRALQAEVSRRCPELEPDWDRLLAQARRAAHATPEDAFANGKTPLDERVKAVRKACRALIRLLAQEEDEEVARLASDDLAQVRELIEPPEEVDLLEEGERWLAQGELARATETLEQARRITFHRLPLGRRSFDPKDEKAAPYLRALDLLGEALKRQCRFEEAEKVLAERVRRCGTPPARTSYGAVLQFLKRPEAALEQFRQLPQRDPARFFNEAAALLDANRHLEALQPLLVGLVRDPEAAREIKRRRRDVAPRAGYWERNEEIWSEGALRFLALVIEEPMVRVRMGSQRKTGRVRKVMHPHVQKVLLKRIWESWRNSGGKPRFK